jgi:glycosyltransferase involved in cell wall biosynthesis
MTLRLTVSVALASFNGERFLTRQLESIARQSRRPDQVVVSDGGSTDGTVELVRSFFAAHPDLGGVIIADGARLGVTANFQRALSATTGQLIALCDQDDEWMPNRLERGMEAFRDPAVLLTHSDARLVDVDGNALGSSLFAALGVGAEQRAQLGGSRACELLIRRNLVTGATTMVRRELVERAVPFPGGWIHDEWLAILAAATGRLVPIDESLIDYRQHGANQIGVIEPTLRRRLHRMVEPRGDRYPRLARRSRALLERLDSLDAPERWRQLAQSKLEFEERRARYPKRRVTRLVPIVLNARGGSYPRLSSQGGLDVLRDLVQPG